MAAKCRTKSKKKEEQTTSSTTKVQKQKKYIKNNNYMYQQQDVQVAKRKNTLDLVEAEMLNYFTVQENPLRVQ